MFGRSIAFLFVMLFMISIYGQAGAVTNGRGNGTYDFGSLLFSGSGGPGFKIQGDKFKVSNAFEPGGDPFGAATSIYAGDGNGIAAGATSTLVIKAEGGTTNKHFTLKNMDFDATTGTDNKRYLDTFTITLKDSDGSTIATHSLSSNVNIPDFGSNSKSIISFPFSVPFPAAGYDYVSEITITWHFISGYTPSELNFNSITVANVSIIPRPTVTSNAASGVSVTGATLNGTIANGNSTAVTFDYGLTTGYGSSVAATESPVTGSSAVSAAISGLTCGGATYHFRVKGVNGDGTTNGSDLTFTTGACPSSPTVTTQAVSSITSNTATGNGNITSLGSSNPTEYGVVWNTATGPTVALGTKTAQGTITSTGTFTSSMSVLTSNTTYYVRAYATNMVGTSYGGEVSFTTPPMPYAVTYSVTISNAASANGIWDGNSWIPTGSGANVKASEIQNKLAAGDVVIGTNSTGGENGDITIAAPLTWSANKLTLNAARDIKINAVLTARVDAMLDLEPISGSVKAGLSDSGFVGRVDFPGRNGSGFLTIKGAVYTVINSLGSEGSATGSDLQGMSLASGMKYALGADIDAAATSGWASGQGFLPLGGEYTGYFSGVFDGLGHTISDLTVNRPDINTYYVGLFGQTDRPAELRNLGLIDVNINGYGTVGGLVGANFGAIRNSYATGSVTGLSGIGGLVGYNQGSLISDSYAGATVKGYEGVGGLVGESTSGVIADSRVVGGSVSGLSIVGGLVASCGGGAIIRSSAAVSVAGAYDGYPNAYSNTVGGLVGVNRASVTDSFASGSVSGSDSVGGLIGENYGPIKNAYAVGLVSDATNRGGLLGYNAGIKAIVSNSFWDTTVNAGLADNGFGVGKSTEELRSMATFSGWDMAASGNSGKIWRIYEGLSYPLLTSFLTPLTVTAKDAVKTYDGNAYYDAGGITFSPAGYDPAKVSGTLAYSFNPTGGTNPGSYGITPYGLYSNQQGYDISYVAGTLTITPVLTITVTISGNGSVTSNNNTGINDTCIKSYNGGICNPVAFGLNDSVTLTAIGSNSTFKNWSGADYTGDPSDNPGSIVMNGNKAVTATFTPDKAKIRIGSDPTAFYTLDAALAAAPTPVLPALATEIRAQSLPTVFSEDIVMTNPISILLKGGYDDTNFTNQAGYTTVRGSLRIRDGKLLVERVKIKGQ